MQIFVLGMDEIIKRIFSIENDTEFEALAFQIFKYQYKHNKTYHDYCSCLKKHPDNIQTIKEIPFLPVDFFKNKEIVSIRGPYDKIYTSSATTGMVTSKHYVKNFTVYEQSYQQCFKRFYGDASQYCILALLPSYLERKGSSLIDMAEGLIRKSRNNQSGFFLNEYAKLKDILMEQETKKNKTILLGVSFALLDFAERYPVKLLSAIVMETGGMKGRRKEMTREELHIKLCDAFGIENIHSEYGMTELLSQAYSCGKGRYFSPPWMKIMIRDQYDPFSYLDNEKTGGINIIDLSNLYSCSFIETKDLGKCIYNGGFEVAGRFDNSDIRGCNLLIK